MCEICENWVRGLREEPRYVKLRTADGVPNLPDHHPDCPRYNDSLMDVWVVSDGTTSFLTEDEQSAREEAQEVDDVTVTPGKMHREVYEHLREFEGF